MCRHRSGRHHLRGQAQGSARSFLCPWVDTVNFWLVRQKLPGLKRPRRFPTGGQINADRVLGTPYAFEEHMWGMGTERRAKPSPTLQLCIDQHSDGMTSQRYAARRRGFALVSNMKEHYQHTRVNGIEY